MTYYILTFIAGLLVGVCFKYRFVRALIHLDKEFNDELLNGRSGETISTRAGRALIFKQRGGSPKGYWKWCVLCRLLDLFDPKHCIRDYEKVYGKEGVNDPYYPPS